MENITLNLKEIKEKLKNNPEPKEVTKTRKLIEKSFSKLEFMEDVHKYYLPQADGTKIELPSVSSVIETWVPQVDWDVKAAEKALKIGVPVEELKEQWHINNITSTHRGSKTHWFGEQLMNMFIGKEKQTKKNLPFQYTDDNYIIPYNEKECAIVKYYRDILDNPNVYPVMPEAKIYMNLNDTYNLKNPYAGTFDILLAYNYKGKIVYSIHDFKTNAGLYKSYSRLCGVTMLPPFDHLFEEPYSHYAIQLSLYALGLRQLGLEIVDHNIIWLKDDGTYEKIKTPDLTEILLPLL